MDVLEAIAARKSIRAFKPDPVPEKTIKRILKIAQRAPSGTNTQPWHIYVCAGDVKQAITEDVLALARAGKGRTYEEYDYYPAQWKDIHRDRRRGIGWALYGLLGIKKGDREASARQGAKPVISLIVAASTNNVIGADGDLVRRQDFLALNRQFAFAHVDQKAFDDRSRTKRSPSWLR